MLCLTACTFRSFLTLMSTLIMVAVVAPFALPALVMVLGAFYFLYVHFQNCSRQVKRLDAVSRWLGRGGAAVACPVLLL